MFTVFLNIFNDKKVQTVVKIGCLFKLINQSEFSKTFPLKILIFKRIANYKYTTEVRYISLKNIIEKTVTLIVRETT